MNFNRRQVLLDTETTGLDPLQGHRLTEIGCIEIIDRRPTGRHFQTYLNPERETDEGALKVTGLTTDFLKDKPKFSEVVEDLLAFVIVPGTELIIHNAPFDLGFLNYELSLLSHAQCPLEQSLNVIDTLVMARRLHPGQRNNLDALCKRYNIENNDRAYHGALLDARLLMRVYLAMTAGQSQMNLTPDSRVQSQERVNAGLNVDAQRVFIKREPSFSLRVIRATDEEVQVHTARMEKLQSKRILQN
jgi:DNA polymerase-3 subunit epsilon